MMDKAPVLSIVTVTYNASDCIGQTINSVIDQLNENIEYLVIDGGSTDNTVDILDKYKKEIDFILSEKDKGIYDAMNKGITYSKGRYLYFLQAGDELLPGVLNKMFDYFIDEPRFIYGKVLMNGGGRVYGGEFSNKMIAIKNICQQAIFYHKSIFDIVGKHDVAYPIWADHVLNIKCFSNELIKKIYIDIIIAKYDAGISSQIKDPVFSGWNRIRIIKRLMGGQYALYALFKSVAIRMRYKNGK